MQLFDSFEPRRLFAAGAIDTTYGTSGTADARINSRGWAASSYDVASDVDGQVVIASVYGGKKNQLSVARVKTNGDADTNFGKAGFATATLPLNRSGDVQIELDVRGRSLVMVSTPLGVTITRFTSAGTVDKKFGKNGTAAVPIVSSAANLDLDAGGNVVVVGTSQGKTGTRGTVVRLDYRGKLDKTFGSGGAYKTPVPTSDVTNKPGNAVGNAIRVLSDGSIVAASDLTIPTVPTATAGSTVGGVLLVKLDATGTLDPAYGTAGSVTPLIYSSNFTATYTHRLESLAPDGTAVIGVNAKFYDDADGRTSYDKTFGMVGANGLPSAFDYSVVPSSLTTAGSDETTTIPLVQADGKSFARSAYGVIFRLDQAMFYDPSFAPVEVPEPSTNTLLIGGDHLFAFNRPINISTAADPSILKITAIELT